MGPVGPQGRGARGPWAHGQARRPLFWGNHFWKPVQKATILGKPFFEVEKKKMRSVMRSNLVRVSRRYLSTEARFGENGFMHKIVGLPTESALQEQSVQKARPPSRKRWPLSRVDEGGEGIY